VNASGLQINSGKTNGTAKHSGDNAANLVKSSAGTVEIAAGT